MNINLDDKNLTEQEKEIIINNIIRPINKKIEKANNLIKERINVLNLSDPESTKLYNNFKLNIKNLEIKFNKNNLIKII
jgi:hypothetical protein